MGEIEKMSLRGSGGDKSKFITLSFDILETDLQGKLLKGFN